MEPLDELKKRQAREASIKMYQKYIDDMKHEEKAKGQKGKMGFKSVDTESKARKIDAGLFKTNVHKPKSSG